MKTTITNCISMMYFPYISEWTALLGVYERRGSLSHQKYQYTYVDKYRLSLNKYISTNIHINRSLLLHVLNFCKICSSKAAVIFFLLILISFKFFSSCKCLKKRQGLNWITDGWEADSRNSFTTSKSNLPSCSAHWFLCLWLTLRWLDCGTNRTITGVFVLKTSLQYLLRLIPDLIANIK